MKNIIIITSNSIRHNYFKTLFSLQDDINVLRTYTEANDQFELETIAITKEKLDNLQAIHFDVRHNTEYDFFSDIIEYCEDKSNTKIIEKGEINSAHIVNEIIELNPDLIITYGCSIIKPSLIEDFRNQIINVHLGISPYYFGAGTNFQALVNEEFQFVGYTFMYMDEGIDTGKIIHQSRAKVLPFDNPHQIGNRLIKQMTKDFIKLIENFSLIEDKDRVTDFVGKTFKNKDATNNLTLKLYENFKRDSVFNYLKKKELLERKYPIIEQDFLKKGRGTI
jgi:phosphoribosylglycinamide formyltransferase 1